MKYIILCLVLTVTGGMMQSFAQEIELPQRRNIIKADLTSNFYYTKAFVLSYERVMKPHQTMVIHAGVQQFQPFSSFGDSIVVTDEKSASGIKLGFDYRFYLQKENKYSAPRGVYIGPYISYLNFQNKRALEVTNNGIPEVADLNSRLNIINIGFQMGYQFVIKDRWTIDMVFMGPSVSNYRLNMDLTGNFNFDTEDVQNDYIKVLIDKFPAFEDLINEKSTSSNGKVSSWSYGYRYQLQVGYRFGKKK